LPGPRPIRLDDGSFGWHADPDSIGRVHGWHGNVGIDVRAYSYLIGLGGDGLRRVSERAVLNANYLLAQLTEDYDLPYPGPVMHEFVLSARRQKKASGIRALDIAKGLIDRRIHPMTVYFPLIVDEAMMIEPTETESRETLDEFVAVMREFARLAVESPHVLEDAPVLAPVPQGSWCHAGNRPRRRREAESGTWSRQLSRQLTGETGSRSGRVRV
jgi:glycine dehydrogenase subunit 2